MVFLGPPESESASFIHLIGAGGVQLICDSIETIIERRIQRRFKPSKSIRAGFLSTDAKDFIGVLLTMFQPAQEMETRTQPAWYDWFSVQ